MDPHTLIVRILGWWVLDVDFAMGRGVGGIQYGGEITTLPHSFSPYTSVCVAKSCLRVFQPLMALRQDRWYRDDIELTAKCSVSS